VNKEEVLNVLKSDNVPPHLLKEFLSDQDRDIKHEAWNYVLTHLNGLGKEFISDLLRFPDTGTRYRVWNSVPEFLENGVISKEEVVNSKKYFLEMLKDENKVVRSLTWYVTLPLLLGKIINLEEVLEYLPYLCDLLNSDFRDNALEVLEEFKLRCE